MRWQLVVATLLWGLAVLVFWPQLLPAQVPGNTGSRHIITNQLQTEPVGGEVDELPLVQMVVSGEAFDLEVAIDAETMARGLMYREELARNHGMLFPLVPRRKVNFWMKNTYIPLDMLFIRDRQVIQVVHSAKPCQSEPCPLYKAVYPVDMVVELPAGTAHRLAIDYGTPVTLASIHGDSGGDAEAIPTIDPVKAPAKSSAPNPAQTAAPHVHGSDHHSLRPVTP